LRDTCWHKTNEITEGGGCSGVLRLLARPRRAKYGEAKAVRNFVVEDLEIERHKIRHRVK